LIRKALISVFLALAICGVSVDTRAENTLPELTIICWHDVRDQLLDGFAQDPDMTAIDTRDLVAQFELLRGLGYTPIRLQQWLDAREGKATLPAKPVLLTFDDGYRSMHDKVLPLLALFQYPAVAAIVSSWIAPNDVPAGKFMNAAQLNTLQASGWVELASHSHDLHQGVIANPQGNSQPAANARAWSRGQYESDAQYRSRVGLDLARSVQMLQAMAGVRPRAVVWPYGAYNDSAIDAATEQGFTVAMGLESGLNDSRLSPMKMRRILVETSMGLTDFARALLPGVSVAASSSTEPLPAASVAAQELGTIRALRVSLDSVVAANESEQEEKLSALLEQVLDLGVNVVMLDTHSEQSESYFPSRVGRMRADLLNRVSWQLRTRTNVKVFAVLPMDRLGCDSVVCAADIAQDLGRSTPLAGLVLEGAASFSSAQLQEVYQAARHYHPELMTGRALTSLSFANTVELMRKVDFLFLPAQALATTPVASAMSNRLVVQASLNTQDLERLHRLGVRHLALLAPRAPRVKLFAPEIRQLMSTATRHNPRN
jgi:poly-beta-1,6-N-acetyl-D-glucosamine N-deacetylase PgaB